MNILLDGLNLTCRSVIEGTNNLDLIDSKLRRSI